MKQMWVGIRGILLGKQAGETDGNIYRTVKWLVIRRGKGK